MALFIGKVPERMEAPDLEKEFEEFGKIKRCDVKRGPASNYGFVEFENKDDAENALSKMDGKELEGGKIVVEWAKGNSRRERGGDDNKCFNVTFPFNPVWSTWPLGPRLSRSWRQRP